MSLEVRVECYGSIEEMEAGVQEMVNAGWKVHKLTKLDDETFVAEFMVGGLSPPESDPGVEWEGGG